MSLPADRYVATSAEWHRRVWSISWPVVLSNMSVPLVGAVDTAVVGHLADPAYIGGIALGSVLFGFIYIAFNFLRMSTTGFVAQALGAGQPDEMLAVLARAAFIGCGLGLAMILLQAPVSLAGFGLLEGSPQVESLGEAYFGVRIWGAPATLTNYAVLGCLIGIQRTRSALAVQLLLNGLNLALDLLFVLGFGWDVRGVGLASVIAEYVAAVVGLSVVLRHLRGLGATWEPTRVFDGRSVRALVRVNAHILVRTLCVVGAYAYLAAAGAKLGDVVLAANAILIHLQYFVSHGLDGFAHAAEALAGGAYGARRREAFRAAVRASSIWALAVAGVYSLIYALFGPALISLMTGIESVQATALTYLPWLVASPLISVWSFQLDGIYIGAVRSREMRDGMVLSFLVYVAAVWLLVPLAGNHGLWLALMLFMATRAVILLLWYPRLERALE